MKKFIFGLIAVVAFMMAGRMGEDMRFLIIRPTRPDVSCFKLVFFAK